MATKKTILITGCSDGGLGSELCLSFHKRGYRVFASARNLAKLKDTEALGIESIKLDVLSEESIAAAVKEIQGLTGGSLDALLNNAGGGYSMPVLDMDVNQTRKLFEMNYFSLINLTKAFVPLLRKSTHTPKLINHTSVASLLGLPFQSAYSSSKAAAGMLTDSLRMELEPFGIKVIEMKSGAVKSKFFSNVSDTSLPADSVYNLAKEEIEKGMLGEDIIKNAADATTWAEAVTSAIDRNSPPPVIWQGTSSTLARYGLILPLHYWDGPRKSMSGVDVFDKKLKELDGKPKSD
jgi:NAD(P)-dependent dehydrogenase (short-subunit alcohol dehydrogenase family)